MTATYAIVGANLAGGQAAHELRRCGFDGRIVLIGAEPHLPYERPPLSKDVLLGRTEAAATRIWPEDAYPAAAIEVRLGVRATRLRPSDRRVELDDGSALTVDKVLLCTGATPRRLGIPGLDRVGVHHLRTLDDAVALRAGLTPGARVVVIGAGFIGAEVAAAAVQTGCQVTLLEAAPLPLLRVLGAELAALYSGLHRDHGVDLRVGVNVAAVIGDGSCRAVALDDDTVIDADVVVCGVGVTPATGLAADAGINVTNGVEVDWYGRTSIAEVSAAGDVAARPSSYTDVLIRLESWQNAQNQAIAAARAMVDPEAAAFDDLPWFWSDQYDVRLQLAGFPRPDDTVIWRGDPASYQAAAFYLRNGIVAAVVGLNRPRDVRAGMTLITSRAAVQAQALADESVDLRQPGQVLVR